MKKILSKGSVALLVTGMMLMAFVPYIAYAASGLTLEESHEWENGDKSYVNEVATGDVDGDNVTEIVTVGFFHDPAQSAQPFYAGKIDVWNWNGTLLDQEHEEVFSLELWSNDTRFYTVNIGNVDNDTETEIVAAGYARFLGAFDIGLLAVCNWNGTDFKRKALAGWPTLLAKNAKFFGAAVGDVDQDGITEIIAVGYIEKTSYLGTGFHGVLTQWNVTGSSLVLEKSTEWGIGLPTICESVSVNDVDGDGDVEIIIGGYYYDSNLHETHAMIRIYDGKTLTLEKNYLWINYRRTEIHSIITGDIDLDGIVEIVTIGDHWDGYNSNGQIGIWYWDGDNLMLETSREWSILGYAVVIRAVAIGDVDKDDTLEVITSGFPSQLRFWSWNGSVLTLENTTLWNTSIDASGIATDDVDDDGVVEIVTGGSHWTASVTRSALGIWSVSQVASSITVNLSAPSIVINSQVTISGAVTNETDETPIPNVEVTIEYSHGPLPGFTHIATVTTNEDGEYTFTWIPPAAGSYTIRASWKGDFEHEDASNTVALTVEKDSSLIALALSSYAAKIGNTISVNGSLYPAKATSISIEYTMPNGTKTTKTLNSNSAGIFSDTFTANHVGQWIVKATWAGDNTHAGTASSPATLTVTKIGSTIILVTPSTVNVDESMAINGTLTPGQTATITLTYIIPNGTTTTRTVASTSTGTFTDTIKFDQTGTWLIKANWNGNEQYEGAESSVMPVAAQTVDQTTPIFAMAGLGLGVVALIIAIGGIYMILKKKTSAPPSSATIPAPPTTPT